jgi:pyridoxamine 5'-phosphate oxidase
MKLQNIRKEYNFSTLSRKSMPINPFEKFQEWLKAAIGQTVNEPTAMAVSTIGPDGFPDSRIVLLKHFDDERFTFFTNYESSKGIALAGCEKTALLFFWPELERQIRIKGIASKCSSEFSDNYFNTRPLESRIAVLASNQSHEIPSRAYLESEFERIKRELGSKNPARPNNWGGYHVKPNHFEFWQGRSNRLHDRFEYRFSAEGWILSRLAP